jgi:predicted SprT family Zn-dependent metalloprotease
MEAKATNPFVAKMIAVRSEAIELMDEHGLLDTGWKFQFSDHRTIVGQCDHIKKHIKYSQHFLMKTGEESITDTLLHEIAHALVGSGHGHDYVWRSKAIELGCNGERTCGPEAVTTAKHNYYMECPTCFKRWYRYRMKSRNHGSRCPDCHTTVKIYKIVR